MIDNLNYVLFEVDTFYVSGAEPLPFCIRRQTFT